MMPGDLPDSLGVDANGFVWRFWDEGDVRISMAPNNPDNSPIPEPITYYRPLPVHDPRGLCTACGGSGIAEWEPMPQDDQPTP